MMSFENLFKKITYPDLLRLILDYFLTYCRFQFVKTMVPRGQVWPQWRKPFFTCLYRRNILKVTTEVKKLKSTWKLSDMVQNQYPQSPDEAKGQFHFFHIWAKVSQVSDVAHGPLVLKSSSPEPLGQIQSNLVQIIFGWREFKFVQMKG